MKISQVMRKNPELISPEDSVCSAAELMRDLGTGVLPVGEGLRASGIITDRDITIRAVAEGLDCEEVTIGQIMTKQAFSCREDESCEAAFEQMMKNNVGRLLITNKNDEVIGIVSMADLIETADKQVLRVIQGNKGEELHPNQQKKAG